MPTKKTPTASDKRNQIVTEARRDQARRERGYREKALKMFPWICGRCGREFTGQRVRELTVHHKDHDHDNNPPDGSNWELLCIYCHDYEHSKYLEEEWHDQETPGGDKEQPATYQPFAGLDVLLEEKKDKQ